MSDKYQAIRESFTTMRRESKARHRDIAEKLNISEAELIAAHAGVATAGQNIILQAICLRKDWPELIASLEPLGEVMARTRNASCVHEKTGVYRKLSQNNHVGLVLGGEIDLRIFYQQWAHGFAVTEQGEQTEQSEQGEQRSLQFFDASGSAIHKIFMKPHSELQAYEELVRRFAAHEQITGVACHAAIEKVTEVADADIDVVGLRQAWASLRDTDEFFGLLKKFSVSRTQALRLAEPRFVQQVDAASCQELLQSAALEGLPVMVFVGNPGMLQIHSGPIKKIAALGPWVNVFDGRFNLHLQKDQIASSWVVKMPTVDGLVTSLELFDAKGETIAMFFGERKPGKPELCAWRALIENLLQESESCAV